MAKECPHQIKVRSDLLPAFIACILAGASRLEEAGFEVFACLQKGESTLDGPDVGFAVFQVPDGLMDDLRSVFAVGWEGLDPADVFHGPAEEVARLIGLSPASPRP